LEESAVLIFSIKEFLEDRGSRFLRNVDKYPVNLTVPGLRRQ
jgi:hypothetical protein